MKLVLAAERYVGFIDLDNASQWTPVEIGHRPLELVKQEPGGLVAAEAQLRLELKGGHPVRMGGEKVGCQKLDAEREMRTMHHRSGDERGLVATARGGPCSVVINDDTLAFPYPWPSGRGGNNDALSPSNNYKRSQRSAEWISMVFPRNLYRQTIRSGSPGEIELARPF